MPFSDENLIAYLLGDASREQRVAIEQELSVNSELFDRLTELRQVLGHIDSLGGFYEPPGDLVESTLARISDTEDSAPETSHRVQPSSNALSASELGTSTAGSDSRRRVDSTALTLSLTVLCCMALPAMLTARFVARKNQCAHNLSGTGFQAIDYAMGHPENRLPYVGLDGRGAFAGVYAVRLRSAGYSLPYSQLQCPSLIGFEDSVPTIVIDRIPNFVELRQIALSELALWQRAIGGDYAYNLGVLEENDFVAPRCEGRAGFAILSDAPVFLNQQEEFNAHEGRGINIFYEDGSVRFIQLFSGHLGDQQLFVDHPFRNLSGEHAIGLTESDASLAPSHCPPFGR